uniref:Aspartate/methionine/tyrosine aminotransferase n=1 Tax=Candidatus Kentrum sp. LPFa TaxID=2126335 RepID=A0A450VXP7_9GAMM|nr:MAG: Aspartate/methionine/tyrosine aminotransferase [Candidatus Kentron sp. LPFa]VFK25595.1 MAG: Aspartate/methionine/tyrosine aminotransferase [Candidatus Kentron sp. LPFa]
MSLRGNNYLRAVRAIKRRKKIVESALVTSGVTFGDGSTATELIDAFHGEMHFGASAAATDALNAAWADILMEDQIKYIQHDKKQPKALQAIATKFLFSRLINTEIDGIAGLNLDPSDTLVVPYSSTQLLIAALTCRPKKALDIALCPEGFYKDNVELAASAGLKLHTFPVDLENDGIIVPEILDNYLSASVRPSVLWLTMPGNPLIGRYNMKRIEQVARVVLKHDLDVLIDMAFDKIMPKGEFIPFPNIRVRDAKGQFHLMFDRTYAIVGNSKGINASGPWKMGAGVCGNRQWMRETHDTVTAVTFQRESAHLIQAGTANTSEDYLARNRNYLIKRQSQVTNMIDDINRHLGDEVLISYGKPEYGPFRGIRLSDPWLKKSGIEDSWQFSDLLLAGAGIDSVAFAVIGITGNGVRLNVACPRIKGIKSPENVGSLFIRLEFFLKEIDAYLDYVGALKRIGLTGKVNLRTLFRQ